MTSLGLTKPTIEELNKISSVEIFDEVESDPSRKTLLSAIEIGKKFNATGIIGFGGGSSMDVAKLVALILGSNEDLEAAWGVAKAKGPRLPLVLIPTTAGTGSEVTPVAIITVGEEEKKRSLVSNNFTRLSNFRPRSYFRLARRNSSINWY